MNSFFWMRLCVTFVVSIALSEDRFKVVAPPELVAFVGNEIVLPCYLKPPMSAVDMKVEWSRPDQSHTIVHLYKNRVDEYKDQNISYKGRTSGLLEEDLTRGITSVHLIGVRRSDEGKYQCSVVAGMWNDEASLALHVIGLGSRPEIFRIEAEDSRLRLECRTSGWFPKPEMMWLDSEGHSLTSESGHLAKFSYTDVEGLYTVTGEVVVKKSDINTFLCRIHLRQNNHTTESEINISGDIFPNSPNFYTFWSRTSLVVVSLVILSLVVMALFKTMWKKSVFKPLECFKEKLGLLNKNQPLEFEHVIQNRVSITLDSHSAHSDLHVQGEQVHYNGQGSPQVYSKQRPEREYHVLGVNRFSGKHYFEVQFEGSWVVGVASESINPSKKIKYGRDAWTLSRRNGKVYVHDGTLVPLSEQQKCPKMYEMGVYVDYLDKQVSFYNVGSNVRPYHIYSYTECNFSESLCPFFRTWSSRNNVLTINNIDDVAVYEKCRLL